ncbi:MAG: methyltransferase domain-containing protein [Planctomycetota bacterium]|jgi:SAM-dependent methyltransferase
MIAAKKSFEARCHRAACRSCGHQGLRGVLDLGQMPLSDGLLTDQQLKASERHYPLEAAFCPGCSLVQILETVPPEILFGEDYPYYSSFSRALLEHSRRNALGLISSRNLTRQSLVVEVASNDGYLLRNFVERGIPALGIDPAPGPVAVARNIGVPTMQEFFGIDLARRLRDQGKRADVIIANNVFAHVADTNGFVAALAALLKDDGVVVIEVPYVRDLVDKCEFDTIYHEHLCYFSATSVDRLVRKHGLYLNKVERLGIHGGSLRLYLELEENVGESVRKLLAEEEQAGLDSFDYYRSFARRVMAIRRELKAMLAGLKRRGCSIAAYGAAAKGTILLNYVGAGKDLIDFVVDRNVHKQGKYMPGVHIPIFEPDRIRREMPDYILLLPWNFKDEILKQCHIYRRHGGHFIIPIPRPEVV